MVNFNNRYSPYYQVFEIINQTKKLNHKKKIRHLWSKFGSNFSYEPCLNQTTEKIPQEEICYLLTKSSIACDILETIDQMGGKNSIIDIFYHGKNPKERRFIENRKVTCHLLTSRKYSVMIKKNTSNFFSN